MLNLRKLLIPTGEHKEVEVVQTWEVRWHSAEIRVGYSLCKTQPEVAVFTSREAAEDFAERLREAYSVTKVSGIAVKVNKAT